MNIDSELKEASERLAKLYDLKSQISSEYDNVRDSIIFLMKKKGIKRVATENKNISMTSEVRKEYKYELLKDKISELGLFDKVVKTSINREALDREIDSGYFPAEVANKALKKTEINKILVKERE